MLNWLVPAWVGSRNKKQLLSTMLFGGSSLPRSVTNGSSAVLLVVNLAFWWVYLICRLITYVYVFLGRIQDLTKECLDKRPPKTVLVGGSGGMLPRKNFNFRASEMRFPAFSGAT